MTVAITVLGCGRIGRMHADMIARQVPGAALAGVFDVVPEAAATVAHELGCVHAESLEAALDIEADAVAICTPTDTHVEQIIGATERGRHIFCEKPVSLDLAELDRALAAVETAGVTFQVGFNRRHDPSHAAVAQAVRDGKVGDVHLCRITSRDPGPPPISYIESSGGLFNDMTIHDFDMARYVTGSEVVEVVARGAVLVDPAIGEAGDIDTAVVLLTHENGALTTIDNSRQAVYGYDQRVEVFGSAGMASSANHHETTTLLATTEGVSATPLQHFFLERYRESYLAQWARFVACLVEGTPSPAGPDDGRAPLLIGAAAAESVATGQPVTL